MLTETDEHHEHRYVDEQKQRPSTLHGRVNDAMANAIQALLKEWPGMIDEWEQTRDVDRD